MLNESGSQQISHFRVRGGENKNASLRRSWSALRLALRIVIDQAREIAAAFQGIGLS